MYIIISGQLKFKCCSIRRVDIVLGVPDVGYLHPKVGHDRFSSVLFMANNTAGFALSLSPRFLAMSVYKEKTNKQNTHDTVGFSLEESRSDRRHERYNSIKKKWRKMKEWTLVILENK